MLLKVRILKTLIVLLTLKNTVRYIGAGWVEIPQFSDETKVYRLPSNREGAFYDKFSFTNYKIVPSYRTRNVTEPEDIVTEGKRTIEEYETENPRRSITAMPDEFSNASNEPEAVEEDTSDFVDVEVENEPGDEEEDGEPSQLESPVESSTIGAPMEEVGPTTSSSTSTTRSFQAETLKKEKYKNETVEDKGFLDYLPVEMLKKVHRTLKSQPTTLRGKIRFLKSFENSLMKEIESRLGAALSPARRTRGLHESHYEHGYDDHEDDSIGFPSLEGALLAISFLTFAVYLVRLVMQLFRHINSVNATTAATATLLFGKRRRSVDETTEATAKILGYLDEFPSN